MGSLRPHDIMLVAPLAEPTFTISTGHAMTHPYHHPLQYYLKNRRLQRKTSVTIDTRCQWEVPKSPPTVVTKHKQSECLPIHIMAPPPAKLQKSAFAITTKGSSTSTLTPRATLPSVTSPIVVHTPRDSSPLSPMRHTLPAGGPVFHTSKTKLDLRRIVLKNLC